jgi:hypothetical protein
MRQRDEGGGEMKVVASALEYSNTWSCSRDQSTYTTRRFAPAPPAVTTKIGKK